MKTTTIAFIACVIVAISGCNTTPTTTAPLSNIVTKEVKVPIAACPAQIDQIVYPQRPVLEIDTLTPADSKNYDKVAKAYMSSIKSLKQYAQELEDVAYGTRDICRSINTTISGK